MLYESTRGYKDNVTAAKAVTMGIAPDGGLFVPKSFPEVSLSEIENMTDMDYSERAYAVISRFFDEFKEEELKECINKAYSAKRFSTEDIAKLVRLNHNAAVLELWHGPTCAFKDMALQFLPNIMIKSIQKTGKKNKIVILTATSGDTGKAALEGFKDVEGTKIIVFYPKDGVSEIQKRQMITQEGENVYSIAVKGNFDDAQTGVKKLFADTCLKHEIKAAGYEFSSANSINWGRLVPQIAYYFSAYCDYVLSGEVRCGERINIVVPTGNFGNILAAYYAKKMGLPVKKLICASNINNVLTDFINTGEYNKNRKFIKTISPSMDILISSNLERLLYEITDRNVKQIKKMMDGLKKKGKYSISKILKNKICQDFWGGYADENDTFKTIKCIYDEYGYLLDPHTAVALDVYDKYVISTADMTKTIIVSTASPFKFTESVAKAILEKSEYEDKDDFKLVELLSSKTNLDIPKGLKDLDKKKILHTRVCGKNDMDKEVRDILI